MRARREKNTSVGAELGFRRPPPSIPSSWGRKVLVARAFRFRLRMPTSRKVPTVFGFGRLKPIRGLRARRRVPVPTRPVGLSERRLSSLSFTLLRPFVEPRCGPATNRSEGGSGARRAPRPSSQRLPGLIELRQRVRRSPSFSLSFSLLFFRPPGVSRLGLCFGHRAGNADLSLTTRPRPYRRA